jgi:hypothetical protein
MSLNDDFCQDPVTFLARHVVISRVPNDPQVESYTDAAQEVLRVFIVESDSKVVNIPGGTACALSLARPEQATAPRIYGCPYAQNDLQGVNLGNAALYNR